MIHWGQVLYRNLLLLGFDSAGTIDADAFATKQDPTLVDAVLHLVFAKLSSRDAHHVALAPYLF